jgi:hypothetical protein
MRQNRHPGGKESRALPHDEHQQPSLNGTPDSEELESLQGLRFVAYSDTLLENRFLQVPRVGPGEARFWYPVDRSPFGKTFKISRQGAKGALSAVVMPENHSLVSHHSGHLDCVIPNMLSIMRRINDSNVDGIGIRLRVKNHGVAQQLGVSIQP